MTPELIYSMERLSGNVQILTASFSKVARSWALEPSPFAASYLLLFTTMYKIFVTVVMVLYFEYSRDRV